jgi:hypothetical protein
MKVFHCDHCDHPVFFENTGCIHCGHLLAFLPDVADMRSLEPLSGGLWRSPLADSTGLEYRLCANYAEQHVCNWAVVESDLHSLCLSCRLTRVIPDLSAPAHRVEWFRVEQAKRRLVHTLLGLRLPFATKQEEPVTGLVFDFLADAPVTGSSPVLTGHAGGVITINVAEADHAERERRRAQLHEPYRTVLGHLRHEIGHYYWDRFIKDQEPLNAFRELFGDERSDYAQALQRHYDCGPSADWQQQFVSAYAASHPWEDWAETWAHYLHMTDTLETAAACGIAVHPKRAHEPTLTKVPSQAGSPGTSFDRLIDSWFPVTYVLNNLNRGMGLPDAYPFVLSLPVLEKLRLVHEIVAASGSVHASN